MRADTNQQVHYLSAGTERLPSARSASDHGLRKAAKMNLIRIAGNVFECPSSHDLWRVDGSSVRRLSSVEVDFNEKLKPADPADPQAYLQEILAELKF